MSVGTRRSGEAVLVVAEARGHESKVASLVEGSMARCDMEDSG